MRWQPSEEYSTDLHVEENVAIDVWADGERYTDVEWRHSTPYAPRGAWYRSHGGDSEALTWIKPTHFVVVTRPV